MLQPCQPGASLWITAGCLGGGGGVQHATHACSPAGHASQCSTSKGSYMMDWFHIACHSALGKLGGPCTACQGCTHHHHGPRHGRRGGGCPMLPVHATACTRCVCEHQMMHLEPYDRFASPLCSRVRHPHGKAVRCACGAGTSSGTCE